EVVHERKRPFIYLYTVGHQDLLDQFVLAVAQPTDRFATGGGTGVPRGQMNPPGLQKDAEPPLPPYTIPTTFVIKCNNNRLPGFAGLRRPVPQKRVEHLFPARGVHFGSISENTVQIEEHGIKPFWGNSTMRLTHGVILLLQYVAFAKGQLFYFPTMTAGCPVVCSTLCHSNPCGSSCLRCPTAKEMGLWVKRWLQTPTTISVRPAIPACTACCPSTRQNSASIAFVGRLRIM